MMKATEQNALNRFLANIEFAANGCWIWTGLMDKDGYGCIRPGTGTSYRRAHRFSYEIFVGPIPFGMKVLHSCDTPSCVRPWDLFSGTNRDNINDMMSKGRQRKGIAINLAKLNDDKVRAIRLLFSSALSNGDIARKFGVKKEAVRRIRHGMNWKHVPLEPPS
jgi:hypothetical protein